MTSDILIYKIKFIAKLTSTIKSEILMRTYYLIIFLSKTLTGIRGNEGVDLTPHSGHNSCKRLNSGLHRKLLISMKLITSGGHWQKWELTIIAEKQRASEHKPFTCLEEQIKRSVKWNLATLYTPFLCFCPF